MDIRRNKKKWNAFTMLLTAALSVGTLLGPTAAYGAEAGAHPDLTKKGSVSVTMVDKSANSAVGGGEMTLHHVAGIAREDWNDSYSYTEAFAECTLPLDEPESGELARGIADFAAQEGIAGTTKEIGDDGVVTFENLEVGLYLLTQTKAASGYEAVAPFLVSVPISINGELSYDVNATPKTSGVIKDTTNPTDPAGPDDPTKPEEPTKPGDSHGGSDDDEDDDDDWDDSRRPTSPQPTESVVITDEDDSTLPAPTEPEPTDPEPQVDGTKAADVLPKTGQLWWPVPLLCGAGLLFLIFGWLEKRRS